MTIFESRFQYKKKRDWVILVFFIVPVLIAFFWLLLVPYLESRLNILVSSFATMVVACVVVPMIVTGAILFVIPDKIKRLVKFQLMDSTLHVKSGNSTIARFNLPLGHCIRKGASLIELDRKSSIKNIECMEISNQYKSLAIAAVTNKPNKNLGFKPLSYDLLLLEPNRFDELKRAIAQNCTKSDSQMEIL